MINWLRGWATTLHIMVFERETYKLLRGYSEFAEGDFGEVGPPVPDWPDYDEEVW